MTRFKRYKNHQGYYPLSLCPSLRLQVQALEAQFSIVPHKATVKVCIFSVNRKFFKPFQVSHSDSFEYRFVATLVLVFQSGYETPLMHFLTLETTHTISKKELVPLVGGLNLLQSSKLSLFDWTFFVEGPCKRFLKSHFSAAFTENRLMRWFREKIWPNLIYG